MAEQDKGPLARFEKVYNDLTEAVRKRVWPAEKPKKTPRRTKRPARKPTVIPGGKLSSRAFAAAFAEFIDEVQREQEALGHSEEQALLVSFDTMSLFRLWLQDARQQDYRDEERRRSDEERDRYRGF